LYPLDGVGAASGTATSALDLLADPYDPSDFARKMLSVLSDEGLRQELKKKSRKRAAFFNWEQTAQLTLQGLTWAVERSTRRRKSAA
jgi:glycosyltransferase involved in cell wall biosynthesis